jgi:hypothetical protein
VALFARKPRPIPPACGRCQYFATEAHEIEAEIPGLVVMGSGYSAVRAGDGLCRLHQRYLSESHVCDRFQPAA